jgi:hypothetical protein
MQCDEFVRGPCRRHLYLLTSRLVNRQSMLARNSTLAPARLNKRSSRRRSASGWQLVFPLEQRRHGSQDQATPPFIGCLDAAKPAPAAEVDSRRGGISAAVSSTALSIVTSVLKVDLL